MLFPSKNLNLNLLLTTTVAFTGNILAKAQECLTFKAEHEHLSVEAPNHQYANAIIDNVWNNLLERCGVKELALGCAEQLENYMNVGSGAIGGSWCVVGYGKEAPQDCIKDAINEGCDLGFGTNTDVGVVSTIIGGTTILALGIGVFILLREQYLRRQRSEVRARANAGEGVPVVAVPALVIEMQGLNENPEGRQARRPRRQRRQQRNARRAERHRRARDHQQEDLAAAAAPAALSVVVERSEVDSNQPGARKRGSFSLSSSANSIWNRAAQQAEVSVEEAKPASGLNFS